jgi:hypothetical protein
MTATLKLYKCTRYPEEKTDKTGEWMGALLILTETPKEAEAIFQELERGNKPEQIIEIKPENGVIYDDYMR